MNLSTQAVIASALFAFALGACGGGKANAPTNTSTALSQPVTETQRETAALPQTSAAPVPGSLNCGATKPVWVNLHTKAYHKPGDPYYGRTKNGQYMCASAATAQGFHAAGERHRGTPTPTNT